MTEENRTTVTVPTKNVLRIGHVTIWSEVIGPATAQAFLNTYKEDYRKLRPAFADGLARDMENGDWSFAGDPIKIDSNGNLIDGQHRLHAIIASKTSQVCLIVHGLDQKAYDVTDTGLPRRYSDLLRMRKWTNVANRAALIKMISRWDRGVSMEDTRRLTNAEHDLINDKYADEISRALDVILSLRRQMHMKLSTATFAFWLLSRVDAERAFTFFVSLAEGENLRRKMPIYTLRERLLDEKDEPHTHTYHLYLIFRAWNAFMDGRDLETIAVPASVTRDRLPDLVTTFWKNEVHWEEDEEEGEDPGDDN